MTLEGVWGIYFCKLDSPNVWKVMKTFRSDGILTSAKGYSDSFKYKTFESALSDAKKIINWKPRPKYDVKVVRLSTNEKGALFIR